MKIFKYVFSAVAGYYVAHLLYELIVFLFKFSLVILERAAQS